MVKAAAAAGYLDERAAVLEILTSLRRAGADIDHHLPREGRRPMAGSETSTADTAPAYARRSAAARTAPRSRSTTSTASCST